MVKKVVEMFSDINKNLQYPGLWLEIKFEILGHIFY